MEIPTKIPLFSCKRIKHPLKEKIQKASLKHVLLNCKNHKSARNHYLCTSKSKR